MCSYLSPVNIFRNILYIKVLLNYNQYNLQSFKHDIESRHKFLQVL